MSKLPSSCKAWEFRARGSPDQVLKLVDHHIPTLGTDELVVKVEAAGLNPVDWKLMKMVPKFFSKSEVVGCDYSGTVVASSSSRFQSGDQVYGYIDPSLSSSKGWGTLTQYAVAPASMCAIRPQHLDAEKAAGIGLVGLMALSMARQVKDGAGQRVFVNGGSTAVGLSLIPMLKKKGAYVISTASGEKVDVVKQIGADVVLDYRKEDVITTLRTKYGGDKSFDEILDCVGSFAIYKHCAAYLKKGGTYGNIGADFSGGVLAYLIQTLTIVLRPKILGGVPRPFKNLWITCDQENMESLDAYIQSGVVQPIVDSTFPFQDTLAAFRRQMTNRALGKVVVTINH